MTDTKKTFVTIGIAVYNVREDFLRSCIESVIKNSDDRTQIIIVDDCSNESTAKICRGYNESDSRILYIRHEVNKGIGAVRNTIIKNASGKHLLFIDGDDMLEYNFADCVTYEQCEKYDMIFFAAPTNSEALRLKELSEAAVSDMLASAVTRRETQSDELKGFAIHPGSVCSVMYRTDFLRKNGCRFKTELKIAEDSMFNASAYLAHPKIAIYPKRIYYYRNNPQSVTRRYDKNAKALTDCCLNVIEAFIAENNVPIREPFIKYRCTSAVIDNFKRDIFHRDNPKSRRERKKNFLHLINSEPYKTALSEAIPSDFVNHKMRLTVIFAKKRRFAALDFCFRHKLVFRLYGGAISRIKKIKGMLSDE